VGTTVPRLNKKFHTEITKDLTDLADHLCDQRKTSPIQSSRYKHISR
jgi:hypothetical protein